MRVSYAQFVRGSVLCGLLLLFCLWFFGGVE